MNLSADPEGLSKIVKELYTVFHEIAKATEGLILLCKFPVDVTFLQ
jgi:hypothetical protein